MSANRYQNTVNINNKSRKSAVESLCFYLLLTATKPTASCQHINIPCYGAVTVTIIIYHCPCHYYYHSHVIQVRTRFLPHLNSAQHSIAYLYWHVLLSQRLDVRWRYHSFAGGWRRSMHCNHRTQPPTPPTDEYSTTEQ